MTCAYSVPGPGKREGISVIIPAYNEEGVIGRTLESLCAMGAGEIIVVDGDSSDRTIQIARSFPVRVIAAPRGRAVQMNRGAEASRGETLLFLHADCRFGPEAIGHIQSAIAQGFAGGCFSQRIDSPRIVYRFIETSGNLRARLSGVFYGDQGIFARRDVFFEIGGFDEVELFEDVLFSKKLSAAGSVIMLRERIIASPRRWERTGVVKTTLLYWRVTAGFILGVNTRRLKRLYRNVR